MKRETVRDFLRRRGSAPHVVAGGLPRLVRAWERFAASVERGYPLTLDDYLDDLDGRQILAETLSALPHAATAAQRRRLVEADARVRAATRPGPCLWGEANAQAQGWTPRAQWWYFRHPVKPGPEAAADLAARFGKGSGRGRRGRRARRGARSPRAPRAQE
jgi:hypothetical protein